MLIFDFGQNKCHSLHFLKNLNGQFSFLLVFESKQKNNAFFYILISTSSIRSGNIDGIKKIVEEAIF